MKIGFIGAGKTGFTLGKYFVDHGVLVSGYFSRCMESAEKAAAFTGTAYFDTLEDVLSASGILFLTVPDTAITEVWNRLKMLPIQNKRICHCSGLMSSADFTGIDECRAFGYSIHPLFAIASKTESYKKIEQAVFTIEGSKEHLCCFQQLFERLGNQVCIISPDQKVKYHGAAVFLSNHVTALAHIGCKPGRWKEMTSQRLKSTWIASQKKKNCCIPFCRASWWTLQKRNIRRQITLI